jgi:hypothetical protein
MTICLMAMVMLRRIGTDMTRKDYIAFAQAFKEGFEKVNALYPPTEQSTAQNGYAAAIDAVVEVLKRDNYRFDENRFREAMVK